MLIAHGPSYLLQFRLINRFVQCECAVTYYIVHAGLVPCV